MKRTIILLLAFLYLGIIQSYSQSSFQPPENKPAVVKWDSRKRQLKLLYNNDIILDAIISVVDENQFPVGKGIIKLETSCSSGDAVTQRLRFTLESQHNGAKIILKGRVFGSEEAFPAEESDSEDQKKFPYVRTCTGLSRNLRNNTIYDRHWDWMLTSASNEQTQIIPVKKLESTEFLLKAKSNKLELLFKPRYYQKHKNIPYFEPWTYEVWKESVSGYCTWWAYRSDFNQKEFDKVLDLIERKNLVDFGYKIMQIDACFATGNGSPEGFLEWNEKFPGGPDYFVRKTKALGMNPGIHTYYVFNQGDTVIERAAKEHPDWFMQNPDGSLLCEKGFYSLNPYNEEGVEHLLRKLYRGLKDQGWDYVKIDGAGDLKEWGYREYPEHLKELNSSPEEALRMMNAVAREELGNDVYILTCWSVKPELAGTADGCRLGRDAFGPAEFQYFNSWNGVVWRNDPDHCDILPDWLTNKLPWYVENNTDRYVYNIHYKRKELPWYTDRTEHRPGKINPDMIVRPAIISMAGGVLMLSDRPEIYENDIFLEGIKRSSPVLFSVPGQLYDYSPEEADKILLNTESDKPHPPQYGGEAEWWMMEVDKPFDYWSVLARFNWRKRELFWNRDNLEEKEVYFEDLGLDPGKEYLVYEFWSKQFLGKKKYSFVAPPQTSDNGLQVFSIREAREYPWVVSTSRHISQGGVDLYDLNWDESSNTLSGKSAVIKDDPYTITVSFPEGYSFIDIKLSCLNSEVQECKDCVAVTIIPAESEEISWSIIFSRE